MNIKKTLLDVIRSVLPITIVMFLLQVLLSGFDLDNFRGFFFGVVVTIVGFVTFLVGVDNSLIALGETIGKKMMLNNKIWFILGLGVVIGFSITVAEPGVQILANQLDSISTGSFINKYALIIAMSLGVGIYLALGIIRFVYKVSLKKIFLGSFILIFLLATICPAEFLAIAFDAGGVTTGLTTVPFILSLGVGMNSIRGTKQQSHESFGFVGLASVGPILAVLIMGVLS